MKRPLTLVALGVIACGGPAVEEGDVVPAADESIVGEAQVVGTDLETWVQIRTDAGEARRIVGALESEIGALQSARVEVLGTSVDDGKPGAAFHAADYEILEIGGETPIVGTLLRVDSDFWIAEPDSVGGARLQLIGVPAAIGEATGGKIWVVGVRGTSEVRVQSYGVIRMPPGT